MGKAWADKEHAAENQYFNKKDAEVLAKLADKLKNHTAVRFTFAYNLILLQKIKGTNFVVKIKLKLTLGPT